MSLLFYLISGAFLLTISLTYLYGVLHLNKNHQANRKKNVYVLVSMISALMPLFLWGALVYVFYQGGSNSAQFSHQRYDLWSFWFHIYLPSLGCSVVAALLALAAFFMELQPRNQPYSFICRLSAVLSFLPTFYVLFTTIPDA